MSLFCELDHYMISLYPNWWSTMHANRLMPNVYRKKLLAFTIALTPDPDAFPSEKNI